MLSIRTFGSDIAAGLSVACVALPLNLALAMAAGLPASAGLVAGVVAGVVAGLLGGARLQISGPEAALVPLSLLIVERHGAAGLLGATLIAGLFQILLGIARVGRVVRFVPVPVVRGFTAGIGLLIIASQIPRWLGLPTEIRSVSTLATSSSLFADVRPTAMVMGVLVMAALLLLPRIDKRIPASLVGLIAVTAAAAYLRLDLAFVGAIPSSLPAPTVPPLASFDLHALVPDALSLALLASLGSLLSAAAVDGIVRGKKHNSDQELCAQGIANITSSLVGGMPVMGAIVRSSVSVEMGGRTRLASVAHAGLLFAAMSIAAPLVARIPTAALAAILLVVGVRLCNIPELFKLWRASRADAILLIATAGAIIATNFILGVAIGMALSLALFVQKHPQPKAALELVPSSSVPASLSGTTTTDEPPMVAVVRVQGSMLFATDASLDAIVDASPLPRYLVLDLEDVPGVDFTGLRRITDLVEMLRSRGCETLLSGANKTVRELMQRSGASKLFASAKSFDGIEEAVAGIASLPRRTREELYDREARLGALARLEWG